MEAVNRRDEAFVVGHEDNSFCRPHGLVGGIARLPYGKARAKAQFFERSRQ